MRRHILFLLTLAPAMALAQSAPNFECAHAIALIVSPSNVPESYATMDGPQLPSTVLTPAAACGSQANSKQGWFSFVATASSLWIRTDWKTIGPRIDVFSGTCGSFTSIACQGAGLSPLALTGLTIGDTYYFRLIHPATGDLNNSLVNFVAVVSKPTNDECTGAQILTVRPSGGFILPSTETSTLAATQSQTGCATAGAANDDVWFRFTATAATQWLHTTPIDGQEMVTQWFSGTCGNLSSLFCDADKATGLTPGQDYYIRQYTASADASVNGRALVDLYAPAPNDECANAIPVNVAQGTDAPMPCAISSMAATSSNAPCGVNGADVWMSFVAPTTTVALFSSQQDAFALFSGSCGSLVCEMNADFVSYVLFTDLIPGNSYYLKAGKPVSEHNFEVQLFAPPVNDDCTGAVELQVDPGVFPETWTNGWTYGATQSMPGCAGAQQSLDDVWFRFTATDSVQRLGFRSQNSYQAAIGIQLLGGDCNAPVDIHCYNYQGADNTLRLSGMTAGSTYYLRAYTASNSATERVGFIIGLSRGVPNDHCAGAIELSSAALTDFIPENGVYTMNAVNSSVIGSCANYQDLWYSFTATGSRATLLVPPLTTWSAELVSGTCDALTSLGCVSNVAKNTFTGLTAGQSYRFHYANSASINMGVPLLFLEPPNDDILGAIALPTISATFAGEAREAWTYGATKSISRLCGTQGMPDDDVWFHFTATQASHTIKLQDGNFRFTTVPLAAGFAIEAYDGLHTDSLELDEAVLGCGVNSLVVNGLSAGDEVYFRVYSLSSSANDVSSFLVSVSDRDNNEATGAMPLPYGDDYFAAFNTTGATQSLPGGNCSVTDFADDDIWFSFTASGQPARIVVGYHTADLALELFSGTPPNLTSIACGDNIMVLPNDLVNGQTYYVRLYSWKNATPVQGRIGLFTSPSVTANSCVDETCLGPILLENPGIEQGGTCWPLLPETANNVFPPVGTSVAPGWPHMHGGTSDSYSSCANFDAYEEVPARFQGGGPSSVISRNGTGMGGMYVRDDNAPDYYEYLDAWLTSPMVVGEPYLVSFYVANQPFSQSSSGGLGAMLNVGVPAQTSIGPAPGTAQVLETEVIDGFGWTNICGIVVADQPYDHITIGSFLENRERPFQGSQLSRSYYFVDDVVVSLIADPSCITSIGDVPPPEENVLGDGDNLRVYPNPASDRVNIAVDAPAFGKKGVIQVFDVTGKLVHTEEVPSLMALQPLELSTVGQEGLYLVMLRVEGRTPRSARLIIRR